MSQSVHFCVALAVGPAGTLLGMFYPFGVAHVVKAGRRAAVPATYAMATLSSVWGSAWAMTAITNPGCSTVILMGVAEHHHAIWACRRARSRRRRIPAPSSA